jgi:spermidine synthase
MAQMRTVSEVLPSGLQLTFPVEEVLAEEKSPFQKVGFYKTKSNGVLFMLDDAVMVTETDEYVYHEMISHLPLFSHPNPKRVLIVGGGDLGAARECLKHPGIEEVHTCEIDGLVVDLSRKFLPWAEEVAQNPRAKISVMDGWDLLRGDVKGRYDLILLDLTDAIGLYKTDHAARLFTPEFFKLLKEALTPKGIIAGQCESAFLHTDFIATIHKELRAEFPEVHNFTATISTYPCGLWCFYFASLGVQPLRDFREKDAERLAPTFNLKYYTPAMHRAAFALPARLEQALAKVR